MRRLRSIIVDDEPMARISLRRMLAEFHEIKVCGEAEGVESAVCLIRETGAEVVFLDVELFGESGFELIPRLGREVRVVFVSGFKHYAVRAFQVNALDYLLKPVSRERLAETVRRLGISGR